MVVVQWINCLVVVLSVVVHTKIMLYSIRLIPVVVLVVWMILIVLPVVVLVVHPRKLISVRWDDINSINIFGVKYIIDSIMLLIILIMMCIYNSIVDNIIILISVILLLQQYYYYY